MRVPAFPPRLLRFTLAGLANTAITILLFELLQRTLPYLVAYSLVYAFGVVLSYVLNARFVFSTDFSWSGVVRFPLVYVVQYALGVLLMWALVDLAGLHPTLSLLIAVAITTPTTYVLARWAIVTGRGAPMV